MDFTEIDQFLEDDDGDSAYEALKEMNDESSTGNFELFYRLADACYIRSNCCADGEEKDEKNGRKSLLLEGLSYARQAYKQSPANVKVLNSITALCGRVAEERSAIREKIELGYEFKKYLDEAISLTPTNHALLHMRGRWSFHVAGLTFLERMIASTLFATPPSASYQDALDDLLQSHRLFPTDIGNLLYLAKTYHALQMHNKMVECCQLILEMNAVDEMDKQQRDEARQLLNDAGQ